MVILCNMVCLLELMFGLPNLILKVFWTFSEKNLVSHSTCILCPHFKQRFSVSTMLPLSYWLYSISLIFLWPFCIVAWYSFLLPFTFSFYLPPHMFLAGCILSTHTEEYFIFSVAIPRTLVNTFAQGKLFRCNIFTLSRKTYLLLTIIVFSFTSFHSPTHR